MQKNEMAKYIQLTLAVSASNTIWQTVSKTFFNIHETQ